MITNTKDYMELLGFQESDLVSFGWLGKYWNREVITAGEVWERNHSVGYANFNKYYSISTFKNAENSRAENIQEIREFVIDIDYGTEHHKRPNFLTYDEAYGYLMEQLPPPTVLMHTGHGFQLHYKLATSISSDADKGYLKSVVKAITQQKKADACFSLEHHFRLPFSRNFKNRDEVVMVEIMAVNAELDYNTKELADIFAVSPDKATEPSARQERQNIVRSIQRDTNACDRSSAVYGLIMRCLDQVPNVLDSELEQVIASSPNLFDHYGQDRQRLRLDIQRIKAKRHDDGIGSVLPINKVEFNDYDLERFEPVRECFDQVVFSSRLPKINTTLSIFDSCYKNEQKAILSLPCSSGKTYSALIFAAATASREQRFWLVSEKIEDCKRNADILCRLGTNAIALHGRDKNICQYSDNEFRRSNKRHICSECENQCGAELKYCSDDYRIDVQGADILCVTHAHYKYCLLMEEIPQSLRMIIIDESPNLLEQVCFTERDFKAISNRLGGNIAVIVDFQQELDSMKKSLEDCSCRRVNTFNSIRRNRRDIMRHLFWLLDGGNISDDQFELYLSFVQFFSQNDNIYGIGKDDTYHFMAGMVKVETAVQTIVLDGSARLQCTDWQDFVIIQCDQLSLEYPNTTLHLIQESPTKSKLSNKAVFKKLLETVGDMVCKSEKVLVLSNKNLSDDHDLGQNIESLNAKIEKHGGDIISLHRGQHIGSNAGREAQVSFIAMSLFSTVATYVLRAAIYFDEEITKDRIWNFRETQRGIRIIPKFTKSGAFYDKQINEQYLRSLGRDLYQAIMRGIIRDNPEEKYDVIALVSIPQIINMLMVDLPKVKFRFVDNEILDLHMQGYTQTEISKVTGKSQGTISEQVNKLTTGGLP